MKNLTQIFSSILALVIFVIAPTFVSAQTDDNNYYEFYVIETKVTRVGIETDDEHPQERRFYVSDLIPIPKSKGSVLADLPGIMSKYFDANVVDPMKAQGILVQYYDDGMRLSNGVVYATYSKQEVEEIRAKALTDLKERQVNIVTFHWTLSNANGLETTNPVMYFHSKEQPLFLSKETKPVQPAKTPPNVQTPTTKRPQKH